MIKILQLTVCFFFFAFFSVGCCLNNQCQIPVKPDLAWETNQLRRIASQLGVSQSRASQMDMRELITDIQIKLSKTDEYHGKLLSEADKKTCKALLYREEHIFKILDAYDLFIQKINNSQIIILPEVEFE